MSTPLDTIIATDPGLRELQTELLRLPPEIREYLGELLLDSLEPEGPVEEEAHRRWLEMESGEDEGMDGDDVIAALRARPRP